MFCTGRFSFIRVARFQCSPSVNGCWPVARIGRIKWTQNRLARSLPKGYQRSTQRTMIKYLLTILIGLDQRLSVLPKQGKKNVRKSSW